MPGIEFLQIVLLLLALQGGGPAPSRPAPRPATRNPHGPINIPCENCHTFTSWTPIRRIPEFSHDKTRYPLRGMHEKVECRQCHTRLVFTNVGSKCADCHADIHRRQFGANCEQCHTVKGWRVAVQDIRNHSNRFPLLGAHAALDCASCHRGAASGQFQGLSTDCYACHARTYQATTGPSHATAGYPTGCKQCHGMNTWLDAKFDHSTTGFALTGAHAQLLCASCHASGKYQGTPATCSGCHATDFQKAANPNHAQAGFPQTCQTCHTTAAWQPASFDHNTFTKFPLTGAHVNAACTSCHVGGKYQGTSAVCSGCHLPDFQKATNPNHVQAGLPQICQVCHNTAAWRPASFDHNTSTKFPLTGAHVNAACTSCHIGSKYTGTPTACSGCHAADFQKATNPNHVQSGFPQTCQVCHNTAAWQPASFNHNTFTKFPLTGAHVNAACGSCHVNGQFTGTPKQCSACHMKDYQGTTNPNHAQAGFPTDCSVCHATSSWAGAKFEHSVTGFSLTGAHVGVTCSGCHVNNNYNLTSSVCSSCHLKNYQATTNPNHVQSGFPQQCEVCHSTTAWQPASFDHNKTIFPLTGRHTTVACASCHVNNNYTTVPTDCYSCHRTVYQTTTNPNHAAAGFPTTCQTCHTTTTWTGAKFNHTWFRIPHHAAKMCSDCHTNSSNYKVFTCTTCHTKAKTDPKHQGVSGYVWNSTHCYQCHRNGGG